MICGDRQKGARDDGVAQLLVGAGPSHAYTEDLDAILSLEIAGDVLCLYNVVAAELPPLDEILRRLQARVRRVELFACPDAFGMTAAEPHVFVDGDDALGGAGAVRLTVRGPFPEGPLMLPRPFRC
ncbi:MULTISPECIES: hypothetical protein [Sorangium]|uniref:hypothetical protein n=1 Tax=Sorangium TaxID=39643 RepID=UPI001F2FEA19|nr:MULTISPECIES: hypothetical protein [Sorangium]